VRERGRMNESRAPGEYCFTSDAVTVSLSADSPGSSCSPRWELGSACTCPNQGVFGLFREQRKGLMGDLQATGTLRQTGFGLMDFAERVGALKRDGGPDPEAISRFEWCKGGIYG